MSDRLGSSSTCSKAMSLNGYFPGERASTLQWRAGESALVLDFSPGSLDFRKSIVMFVPSPDVRFTSPADNYGSREREEKAMGVLDLELQRQRRVEMLREAESKSVLRGRRRARGILMLAGLWIVGR